MHIAGNDFQTNGGGGIDGGDIDITAGGCVLIEKTIDASGGGNLSYGGFVTIQADCIITNASISTN